MATMGFDRNCGDEHCNFGGLCAEHRQPSQERVRLGTKCVDGRWMNAWNSSVAEIELDEASYVRIASREIGVASTKRITGFAFAL